MAKHIETMAPELEASLPLVREEWLQRGLATGPCDREAIESAARNVYASAGIEFPGITVWMSSPLGGALAAAMFQQSQLWGQLRGQLWDQLWGQLGDQLGDQLGVQLRREP